MSITVTPTGGALGAEIGGVDLRRISDADFAAVYRAWLDHSVLLIRGQNLTDDDLIAFSERFGELDWAPIQENGRRFVDGHPEIYVVSNVIENGVANRQPRRRRGDRGTPTCRTFRIRRRPASSTRWKFRRPAATPTSTACIARMNSAGNLKSRIDGCELKHDGTYNSGGYVRQGVQPVDDPRQSPGTYHPLVCTHPETRPQCLYLGRRRNAYIEGLSLAESEALLDELWAYANREELTWYNEWRVGDLVLWDNRCTMHRRDPFDNSARRVMHRTQIKGQSRPAA